MNSNLLDLDNNILEIIGDYVKKDNQHRFDNEDSFELTDFYLKNLKEENKFTKYEINDLLIVIYLKRVVRKKIPRIC